MRIFKTKLADGKEVDWEIGFSIGLARRLKGESQIDLMNPNKPVSKEDKATLVMQLHLELELFLTALAGVTRPQRERLGVSLEQFEDSLTVDALASSRDAFFEEYRDFFSRIGMGTTVKIMEKTVEALTRAEVQIQEIGIIGASSGSSPESSPAVS